MKFKDWYNRALIEELTERFAGAFPDFPSSSFVTQACEGLEDLEMMDRVRQIAQAMTDHIPGSVSEAMSGLISCMGPPLDERGDEAASVTSGYALWPFGEYIGRVGLDDWAASWGAMEELTQRLTSEFAVRPFLAADLPRCLDLLRQRLAHPSHHVRRWVSEGTRTRLPWAKAVPELRRVVEQRLELLEALKDDPSLYVRRSVANHLQDILKDDQEVGLRTVERWFVDPDPKVAWVVKHACRGLLKAGHPRVLELYGWNRPVEALEFSVHPKRLVLGDDVKLTARLKGLHSQPCEVRVDYAMEGPTPSGGRFRKVFRWADIVLQDELVLEKVHPMRERTTRKLPAGNYTFTLLANGAASGEGSITLERSI